MNTFAASNTGSITTTEVPSSSVAPEAAAPVDDFFSDAPLAACPLRQGLGEGEICEACQ